MKYSLSTLLLVTALIAALLGWLYDHRRLSEHNARLNLEAADLLEKLAATDGSGRIIFSNEQPPPQRVYNFTIEQDRADYLRDVLSRSGLRPWMGNRP